MKKQKIIAIEGPNGSGKTTLASWLTDYFNQHGLKTRYIHEPYGLIGRVIDSYKETFNSDSLAVLYTQARADFLNKMSLMNKSLFILDRWTPSTLIYNLFAQGRFNYRRDRYGYCMRQADGMILLNTPFQICLQRVQDRNRADKNFILPALSKIDKIYQKSYNICAMFSVAKPEVITMDNQIYDKKSQAINYITEIINETFSIYE